jgi:hypothetical protein
MMKRRCSAWLIGIVLFVLLVAATGGALGQPELERMIGTVKAVDPEARTVWVITGTGHSLRMMAFHAGSHCRIAVAGAEAQLGDVRRGQIVVVRHRKTVERYEAESIETLPTPDEGRRR